MPQTGSGHMQGRTQECGNKRTQESGNMHTHECTPKQTHAQPPSMTAHLGQPVGVVKLEVLELGHLGQPGATCLARLQCTRILHTHLAHASCTRILGSRGPPALPACSAHASCTRILGSRGPPALPACSAHARQGRHNSCTLAYIPRWNMAATHTHPQGGLMGAPLADCPANTAGVRSTFRPAYRRRTPSQAGMQESDP